MKNYLIFIVLIVGTYQPLFGQSLDNLLHEAAQNNSGLKSQYYRYLAALEKVDQQTALPDPTLSFGYFVSPVETRVGAQDFKISVSQMFPWIGTLKSKEAASAAAAQVEFEQFQKVKNQLFYEVKLAYLDLYLLEKEIALEEQDIEILKSYEPISQTKYEANLVSLTDLIRVQIAIEHAESELEIIRSQKEPMVSKLNLLINRSSDEPILIGELSLPDETLTAGLDSALVNHPSVLKAQSQIKAADEQIKLSGQNRKPSIGIGLDYAFVSERTDMDVPDNGRDIFMPMVSLSLPIFGKKNRALVKESQLMRSSASEQLRSVQLQLTNSWTEKNYLQERANIELIQLNRELEQTELLLNVLLSEYSNNNRNFEELLATQQKLLQLKVGMLKATGKQYRAYYLSSFLTGSTLKEIISYETE